MTEVVPQDIDISFEIAKKSIEEAFNFEVKEILLLGEGWDNLVFKVNQELIFRFSRRKVAIPLLQRENRILGILAPKLSLKVPYPEFSSEGTEHYSYPFYGHREVVGITGCSVVLTEDQYRKAVVTLAKFLKELHSFELKVVRSEEDPMVGAFDRAEVDKMLKFFSERLEAIKPAFNFAPYEAKIAKIIEKASVYKPNRKKPSFVHGDLYHRHMIFNNSQELVGAIDWGDCCVTDPVVDLAVLFQFFPYSAHDDFFKVYGDISKEAYDYARFLGLYYAVALLWYGHDRKDQRLIKTSLETLIRI